MGLPSPAFPDTSAAPMPAPKIALESVRVRRGGRTVLTVERLEVMPGDVLAVLGPNGAGKSTLLQLCGFLLAPSHGRLLLDGREVRGTPLAARRRTTLLLQTPALLNRPVLENVELGLRLRGASARARREHGLRALARFGIAHLAGRRAATLSGGEAQRVALARAVAFEPEIVLLDEPFTALDQPTRELLVGETIAAFRAAGVTVVFVTHDRQEAIVLADRVVVLVDGGVRQMGTPAEIRAAPVDETVARFLGVRYGGSAEA